MIEAKGLTKKFDEIVAVDHIDAKIREGSVFGLIGTNGAGKSTFLRMASGILKPDEGTVEIDGESVYENRKVKTKFFYISLPMALRRIWRIFIKVYTRDLIPDGLTIY